MFGLLGGHFLLLGALVAHLALLFLIGLLLAFLCVLCILRGLFFSGLFAVFGIFSILGVLLLSGLLALFGVLAIFRLLPVFRVLSIFGILAVLRILSVLLLLVVLLVFLVFFVLIFLLVVLLLLLFQLFEFLLNERLVVGGVLVRCIEGKGVLVGLERFLPDLDRRFGIFFQCSLAGSIEGVSKVVIRPLLKRQILGPQGRAQGFGGFREVALGVGIGPFVVDPAWILRGGHRFRSAG